MKMYHKFKMFIFIVSISYSLIIFAGEQANIEPSDKKKDLQNKQIKYSTAISKEKSKNKNKWPGSFIPSEKIDADSSVSFPIDI